MNHGVEIKVLLIEDVETDAELELRELRKSGIIYVSKRVDSEPDLRQALQEFKPHVILSDFSLPGYFDGYRALAISRELAPDIPFIFVSGTIGEENAIESLKNGASDYVLKSNLLRLSNAVKRALDESELKKLQKAAEREIEAQRTFFRKVIDLDKSLIFAKDREGRFALVNEAFAAFLGVTAGDLLGRSNVDLISRSNAELVKHLQMDELEVMDTKCEKFFPEVKITDAYGKIHWLQTVMRPIISPDGGADMILAVSTDITERKQMEDELRQSIERFETIARATNDAVWDWNLQTGYLWRNESFELLFGYGEEAEPSIRFWMEHIHPDVRDVITSSLYQVIEGEEKYWSAEYRFMRHDGSYAYVYDRGYVIRDASGKGIRMIGAMMDMSERYAQEMKIARLHRIRDVLSGINSTIIRVHDQETLYQEACRIAVEYGKFAMAWIGLLDRTTREICPVAVCGEDKGFHDAARFSIDENKPEGHSLVATVLRENKVIFNNDVAAAVDVKYQQELLARGIHSIAALPLSMGDDVIGVFGLNSTEKNAFDEEEIKLLCEMAADISFGLESINREQQIKYLAYYDILTGLPNRELFTDRLVQALHPAVPGYAVALLLLDLERFAYVNDVYGRHVGDGLLKEFANHLRTCVPEQDRLARVGANCFAILLVDIHEPSVVAHFIEEKLHGVLPRTVMVEGRSILVSSKVGVALSPTDGIEAEVLFRNAEAALKSAKQANAKYLFYAREMNALVAEKLILENRLRQALDKQEFILHYQPKINLSSNEVCGLEALIRWQTQDGLVPPIKFIPLLEETGMIIEVGLWAIRKAMEDQRAWKEKGLTSPPIAVNVSSVQIKDKNFVPAVISILDCFPDDKTGLELEITETLIMENLDDNIKKFYELKDKGVRISIDDFGTGYSSLSYMSKLPVNALKIDRSFISDMLDNPDDTNIVSAIIMLAHSLNLKVIAEGVETTEQVNLLKSLECDQFQGYLFSPPVPPHDIETMLKARSTT